LDVIASAGLGVQVSIQWSSFGRNLRTNCVLQACQYGFYSTYVYIVGAGAIKQENMCILVKYILTAVLDSSLSIIVKFKNLTKIFLTETDSWNRPQANSFTDPNSAIRKQVKMSIWGHVQIVLRKVAKFLDIWNIR
jgi:hypothetical protein